MRFVVPAVLVLAGCFPNVDLGQNPDGSAQGGGSASGGGTAQGGGVGGGGGVDTDAGTDAGVDAGIDAGTDAGVDAGLLIAAPRGDCLDGGWCWENPIPNGIRWNAVWAPSASEAWAVGQHGWVNHYAQGQWTLSHLTGNPDLVAISGTAADDVWATGSGTFHYDGGSWTYVETDIQELTTALWVGSPTNVWIGGTNSPNGHFSHFDGNRWIEPTPFGVFSVVVGIAGTAPDDVWIGDLGGSVFHWTGTTYDVRTAPVSYGMWAAARDSVWSGGGSGYITHFDGGEWGTVARPGNVAALWGFSDDDLWGVGWAGDNRVWWRETGSDIFHRTDAGWTTTPAPLPGTLRAIHGSSPANIWAAGSGGELLHYDGGTWAVSLPTQTAAQQALLSIWGTSASNLYTVGDGGQIVHYDGTQWSVAASAPGDLRAVSGSGPDNVWAVGSTAMRFDGTTWTPHTENLDAGFCAVYSPSSAEAWAVTFDSALYRWTAAAGWQLSARIPTIPNVVTPQRATLWGSGPSDVYAGSYLGFMHWNGSSWAPVVNDAGIGQILNLWGLASNDVYADDGQSMLYHFDGARWTLFAPTLGAKGIGGTSDHDLCILQQQSLLVFDGGTWTKLPLPGELNTLYSIYVTDPHTAWIVGEGGQIFRQTH